MKKVNSGYAHTLKTAKNNGNDLEGEDGEKLLKIEKDACFDVPVYRHDGTEGGHLCNDGIPGDRQGCAAD